MRIAQDARQKKNEWAVKYAELRKQKNRKPVRETHTGTGTGNPHRKRKIPRPETRTTGSVQKPALLSISWVGEASGDNPPSTSIPSAASAPALVPFIGGNFGGHEISAQQRADLLAYYLFAMKYGEYMQQPEKREAA